MTVFGNYEFMIETMPVKQIEKIVSMGCNEYQKRRLLAYVFSRQFAAVTIPTKEFRLDYARLLIEYGVDKETVMQKAEIGKTSYYKLKKELNR